MSKAILQRLRNQTHILDYKSHFTSRATELTPKLTKFNKIRNSHQSTKTFHPTLTEGEYFVLPHQRIPEHIPKPSYFSQKNGKTPSEIVSSLKFAEVKTEDEIIKMKRAAKLAASCLKLAISHSHEGVTTEEIDKKVHQFIIDNNAFPSAVNFHCFPKSMCASPNEVACHGLPNTRPLQNGDIISYDCTVFLDGHHGDCAGTIGIGVLDPEVERLVEVARKSLYKGIGVVKPGIPINEIGKTIEEYTTSMNFSVVREFCGHFIGKEMHMPPLIPHINQNHTKNLLQPGQIFTIEPVICQGRAELSSWDDTWTIVTCDNGRCAQFEHTILVTDNGCEILTI